MLSRKAAALAAVVSLAAAFSVVGALVTDEARSAAVANAKDHLHVKFVDGSAIRLRGNTLVSVGSTDVSALRAVLRKYPGVHIQRLFSRSEEELADEKARNERRTGKKQPDKNLWYRMVLPPARNAAALVKDLRRARHRPDRISRAASVAAAGDPELRGRPGVPERCDGRDRRNCVRLDGSRRHGRQRAHRRRRVQLEPEPRGSRRGFGLGDP